MALKKSIDIVAGDLKILRQLLSGYLPDTAVRAFGSRVKGTSRPDSDLDLVVFATPQQKSHVHQLKEALDESNLPFRVDLLVWDEISEEFRENIKEQFFVLQDTGNADVVI